MPSNQPSDNILNSKAFDSRKPLISASMWRFIICIGLYQVCALMFIMIFGTPLFGFIDKRINERWTVENGKLDTITYNTYFLMQILSFFCSRKIKSYEYNVVLNLLCEFKAISVLLLIFGTQYLIINYGQDILHCSPLSLYEYLFCLAFASGTILVWLLMRMLPRNLFAINIDEDQEAEETDQLLFHRIRSDSLRPSIMRGSRSKSEDTLI